MQNITIIVPTFNRADFLKRLLSYYARCSFGGKLLIGDASKGGLAQEVQRTVEQFSGSLAVRYIHLPGQSIAQTVAHLNQMVETPFVTLNPDDDFLVVNGLQRCCDFLQGHPQYTAANGTSALFLLEDSGAHGPIRDLGDYTLGASEEEQALERLEKFLNRYWVALFSLHRTEVWKKMWHNGADIADVAFAAEILPNCLSMVYGRIKHLDTLYLVRQAHDRRYVLKDSYDWLICDAWKDSYSRFQEVMTSALAEQGVGPDTAAESVKKFFWQYLNHTLASGFTAKYNRPPLRKRLKAAAGKIPLVGGHLVRGLVKTNDLRLGLGRQLSLERLLNQAHPEYRHFQDVYQTILNPSLTEGLV